MPSITFNLKSWAHVTLSIIWYYLGHKKFSRTENQKEFWESRIDHDFSGIQRINNIPYYQRLNDFALNRLKAFDGENYLEVGCYFGYRLNKYATGLPDKRFVGLDLSEANLRYGRDRLKTLEDVSLVTADVTKLPFFDQNFAVVYTVVALTHLNFEMIENALSEMIRVCRKNLFLIEVDNRPMGLKPRLKVLAWSYAYIHRYEKLIGNRLKLVSITPLLNDDNNPTYTAFEFMRV